MLQMEHSAILLTCIKLTSNVITFVLSIFKWPFKTGFTVSPVKIGGFQTLYIIHRKNVD